MNNSLTRASTRIGRAARSVFRDGLVSGNGRVAVIGLLAALATLVFAVWLKVDLRRQARVRVPLADVAARVESEIQASVTALQRWSLTADPAARAERARVWGEELIPDVDKMQAIARLAREPELVKRVQALEGDLRTLEVEQAWLEELAHAPGEVPARQRYVDELRPVVESVLASTEFLLGARPKGFSLELLLALAAFRDAVSSTEAAILAYIDAGTPIQRQRVDLAVDRVEAAAGKVATVMPRRPDPDMAELLDVALREVPVLIAAAESVSELRRADDWSLAQAQRARIAPLLERVRATSSGLARQQTAAMLRSSRAAGVGTTVVVLLALVVGALSGTSLYYAFRLRHRMRQIATKAQMLGQYAIEAPLGHGGMGEVYRARHALLRRPTAIKLLRRGGALDAIAQDRFRDEVQLTSQLTHPNTVQVFDYGRTPEGVFYYAMELLEGVDLEALVRIAGPLPPARVVRVMVQVCGSLNEAHAQGLLHRDLKPSNIMLTNRGGEWDVAKVLDFGLAAQVGIDRGGDDLAGTPNYLAPEVIAAPKSASPLSDIYALGCVAYYLVTGEVVFPVDGIEAVLAAHAGVEPPPPSERLGRMLPERFEALIMACLDKDPALRPPSTEQLGRLFEASVEQTWGTDEARAWWGDFGEAVAADTRMSASQGRHASLSALEVERTMSTSR